MATSRLPLLPFPRQILRLRRLPLLPFPPPHLRLCFPDLHPRIFTPDLTLTSDSANRVQEKHSRAGQEERLFINLDFFFFKVVFEKEEPFRVVGGGEIIVRSTDGFQGVDGGDDRGEQAQRLQRFGRLIGDAEGWRRLGICGMGAARVGDGVFYFGLSVSVGRIDGAIDGICDVLNGVRIVGLAFKRHNLVLEIQLLPDLQNASIRQPRAKILEQDEQTMPAVALVSAPTLLRMPDVLHHGGSPIPAKLCRTGRRDRPADHLGISMFHVDFDDTVGADG
ncbi:unnamed protein product [Linum tenue]|uniref:Uncharacterized protein n=1 Tax=Linum tenue TaxID=586396 RepID=A0AAV0HAF9_9ROSI|nr:unnamed protein product [Linum tenue]